ncbi:DUF4158 domain-containing protein [Streptomyces sp. NPDC002120]|uniref:DUF4158 domain-containing protein n=1 Tax=Streptomyces sp. NPDC002120 TaxID=3364631 RepID=UPI0036A192E9
MIDDQYCRTVAPGPGLPERAHRAAEDEVRGFPAARVWASLEGQRALFDRAVVWLVDNRGLLPGITTLTRLVAEVRAQGAPPRAGPPTRLCRRSCGRRCGCRGGPRP